MEAHAGIQFLSLLLSSPKHPMDVEDLEKAIEVAGKREPTGAFKEAGRYYCSRHGTGINNGYLAFQKGTRWLAIIRRDESDEKFKQACESLRTTAKAFARATQL